jgi:hypothetical protein
MNVHMVVSRNVYIYIYIHIYTILLIFYKKDDFAKAVHKNYCKDICIRNKVSLQATQDLTQQQVVQKPLRFDGTAFVTYISKI